MQKRGATIKKRRRAARRRRTLAGLLLIFLTIATIAMLAMLAISAFGNGTSEEKQTNYEVCYNASVNDWSTGRTRSASNEVEHFVLPAKAKVNAELFRQKIWSNLNDQINGTNAPKADIYVEITEWKIVDPPSGTN